MLDSGSSILDSASSRLKAPLYDVTDDTEVPAAEVVQRMQRGVAVIERPAAIDEHTRIGLRGHDLAEQRVIGLLAVQLREVAAFETKG